MATDTTLRVTIEFHRPEANQYAEHRVREATKRIERQAMEQRRCGRVHILTHVPDEGLAGPLVQTVIIEWRDEPLPKFPGNPTGPLAPPQPEEGDAILFRRKDHRSDE